jgi:hypothetical protein
MMFVVYIMVVFYIAIAGRMQDARFVGRGDHLPGVAVDLDDDRSWNSSSTLRVARAECPGSRLCDVEQFVELHESPRDRRARTPPAR